MECTFGNYLRNFNEDKMKKTIFLILMYLSPIIAQPYIYNIYHTVDSLDFVQIGSDKYYKIANDYIQKINVKNNIITN